MPYQLRLIQPSDNTVLANIIRQCFHDYHAPTAGTVYVDPTTDQLFELFQTEKAICWVYEEDGRIAGCCGLFPTEGLPNKTVELVKFYLLSDFRGKGIGKALLQQNIQSAKELGYKLVYIESLPQFSKAVHLYENLGFQYLNHPLGNTGHTGCNIWMQLALS